jgi:hypothetical protein
MSETKYDPYAPPVSSIPDTYATPQPVAPDAFSAPEPMVSADSMPLTGNQRPGDARTVQQDAGSIGVGRVVEEVVAWLKTLASAAVYATLIVIILYRMSARSGVPAERRSRFVALLRTSPLFARLARRGGGGDGRRDGPEA